MFEANLVHSSSESRDSSSLNVDVVVASGVTGRDVSSVAFDASCVDEDVGARPDFRRVRDDLGRSGSDSDSSPEMTGELDRDVGVPPLPRRDFRLAEK
jgi:hypothetical protein